MRYRLRTLLIVLAFTTPFYLCAFPIPAHDGDVRRFDFIALPADNEICNWLRKVSPTFDATYASILRLPDAKQIEFKSLDKRENAFGDLGVFFIGGTCEIRLSNRLRGAERVQTLAFEVANASLQEEHRQIDKGAAQGFFAAREYAIAHEIYEYEAWRLYRRFLFDVERELGEGKVPSGLFFGTPAKRVADYQLPSLADHLKHMEASRHMQHYLDWFDRHYGKRAGTRQ